MTHYKVFENDGKKSRAVFIGTRAMTRAVENNGGIIMETKARKLLKKVERLIEGNEYNLVKLNGVNCSRADLEVLEMVLEHFINNGNYGN